MQVRVMAACMESQADILECTASAQSGRREVTVCFSSDVYGRFLSFSMQFLANFSQTIGWGPPLALARTSEKSWIYHWLLIAQNTLPTPISIKNWHKTQILKNKKKIQKMKNRLVEEQKKVLFGHWRIQGGASDVCSLGPIPYILMQFSATILRNNRFLSQTQWLAPPLENSGSTTVRCYCYPL